MTFSHALSIDFNGDYDISLDGGAIERPPGKNILDTKVWIPFSMVEYIVSRYSDPTPCSEETFLAIAQYIYQTSSVKPRLIKDCHLRDRRAPRLAELLKKGLLAKHPRSP